MARNLHLLILFISLFSYLFGWKDGIPFSPSNAASEAKNEASVESDDKDSAASGEQAKEQAPQKGDWRKRIQEGKRTEVTWEDLYEFNYKKGVPTPFLKAIEGKPARLPGFIIPLSDGHAEKMKEFLIVPEPMMCIHVPPPPPNLLLYGTANPPITVNSLWEPVWLDGIIKVEKKESMYAEAGFTMKVTGIEPYKEEE